MIRHAILALLLLAASMPSASAQGDGPSPALLRNLGLGAIVATTVLAALASLGMEIGPLLAGFGVVGLAISFGSQALVRDVVSGILFMADNAFRVGEYIDTGKPRGTVEKITPRSVQLRHQSG